MSFNENLKEAMYCKNLTTVQLAAITNINPATISNYLKTKGTIPPVDKALRMAKALDVSVEFLVNGFEEKSESSAQQKNPITFDVFKVALKMNGLKKSELAIIESLVELLKQNNCPN